MVHGDVPYQHITEHVHQQVTMDIKRYHTADCPHVSQFDEA